MVMLSVQNLVLVYTTMLSSLAGFCIYDPRIILKQGTVQLIADAMQIPHYPYPPESLSIAGLLLFFQAWIYLTIYVRNDIGLLAALTPLRFLFSFALCGWSYLTSNLAVGNALVFSAAFGDLIFQFWLYATLREATANGSGATPVA
ncbi:increased loss of mitochondrial DNA protein 1 [Protomyces lactucae-debilis]|uniref:Increased loss of mitochondrial DNA protein 1 n=1 Tax=Protomyces lactucae-debilis TaxID=2754530 RepID=A0A1Y2FUC2_PROLT|nr:increased loss of mitochondrial DNA protein 1 [Protomyces lactucae-debilis]ORY87610.1 increased loss of mitochondrial DNA protein 1 [Protomyces lactucae-debilis]